MKKEKVLITGSNRGLGSALFEKFEKEGYEVVRHNGAKHYDLSKMSDVVSLAKIAKDNDVKILINNAAIVCPNIIFPEYELTNIENMIKVNLVAPIVLSNLLFNNLTNIININSMVGLEVKPNRTLYSATKWGLRGFSNSLKKEQSNVKILDVYPTNIQTYPDRINSMKLDYVIDEIYNAFSRGQEELILDGRK